METIRVKKFIFDGKVCFRFPYRTASAASAINARLPRACVSPDLFDDNHQLVVVANRCDDLCALYNSDGWVRPNDRYVVLTPGRGNPNVRNYTCLEVYNALEEGELVVGNYTYKVI